MLTCTTLYETLMSLSDSREYHEGSLGYLPFLLHAKWEQDNGKEEVVDFSQSPGSVCLDLQDKYRNDRIGKLFSLPSWSSHQQSDSAELPERPSEAVLAYAVQTISTLDLSEKNLKREDLVKAFNRYLAMTDNLRNLMLHVPRNTQKTTEEVIGKIIGETESVYDPFCGDGYALGLINAKETNGADGNSILSLIAKIRMDFMGRNADIKSLSVAEHPEITPEGKLKTYPIVISCIDDIDINNEISIVSRDIYNRFSQTVHQWETNEPDGETNPIRKNRYIRGIALGHALAVSSRRCILFSNSTRWNPNILIGMDQSQVNSFIYSDFLEAVITISGTDDGKRFRSKPSTIYIFNKEKDEKHRGNIFFLNATTDTLSSDDIVRIYQETEEISGVSKLVPLSQISDNRRDCLSTVRYTAVIEKQNVGSVSSILHELRRLEERGGSVMNDILQVAHSLSRETSGGIIDRRLAARRP